MAVHCHRPSSVVSHSQYPSAGPRRRLVEGDEFGDLNDNRNSLAAFGLHAPSDLPFQYIEIRQRALRHPRAAPKKHQLPRFLPSSKWPAFRSVLFNRLPCPNQLELPNCPRFKYDGHAIALDTFQNPILSNHLVIQTSIESSPPSSSPVRGHLLRSYWSSALIQWSILPSDTTPSVGSCLEQD
ncbi:hypothetical protein C8J56DRAFT_1050713 [Mycena floridula]|nr:hypothetical protein C8J56DRAFT_1050713 [Mycena floridula]